LGVNTCRDNHTITTILARIPVCVSITIMVRYLSVDDIYIGDHM
jgi:hypothetical protein